MRFTLIVIFIVLASILAAVVLVLAVRGRVKAVLPGTRDIESTYLNLLGALYAIFVSFMVFVVWSRYDTARNTVDAEANRVADVYRLADGLPAPVRDVLRQDCREYVDSVTRDEWPALQREGINSATWRRVDRMWQHVNAMNRQQRGDGIARRQVSEAFLELTELRRTRLYLARENLPGVLWALLFFGAALTLGFALLFRMEPFGYHALKVSVLAAIIAFFLLVIWELDTPFRGTVTVLPDAFEQTREVFEQP